MNIYHRVCVNDRVSFLFPELVFFMTSLISGDLCTEVPEVQLEHLLRAKKLLEILQGTQEIAVSLGGKERFLRIHFFQ